MKEEVTLETIQVRYRCDTCGTGYMAFYGYLLNDPTGYPHQCSHCKVVKFLDAVYPYVRYRESGVTA